MEQNVKFTTRQASRSPLGPIASGVMKCDISWQKISGPPDQKISGLPDQKISGLPDQKISGPPDSMFVETAPRHAANKR